jgi:hypothetical protein
MKSVLQVQDSTSELASCRSWYRDNVADALLEFLLVKSRGQKMKRKNAAFTCLVWKNSVVLYLPRNHISDAN